MAISTAANTSVHTSVNRKVASISGGSALFTTIGPGCWVRHHVTLKCTTGTSMNPKMPTTAAFSYLFIEHESRRERGQHDEKYVEVDEQADRLLVVARQSHRGLHRHAASDNERDPQRKGEQRQEQLPRTNARHDRREEASQGSHADGRQQHRRDDIGRERRAEKDRKRGQHDRLADHEKRRRCQGLARKDRNWRRGRHQHRLERSLFALRREGAAESDEAGEHQREPEDAWRDRRRTAGVDLKAEIADEERKNDELRKRRHELACAPLRPQVLTRDRERDAERVHRTTRSRVAVPTERP